MKNIIILASGSPRRKSLVEALGLEFEINAADIDETAYTDESPYTYVHRLAIEKALAVSNKIDDEKSIIIAGDVTVELDGKVIGKAKDKDEAREILTNLSGNYHYIRDGYAVVFDGQVFASGVASVEVKFNELSEEKIDKYIESGKWEGKAGAYGIQHDDGFVEKFTGGYWDIVGLPVFLVAETLRTLGVGIEQDKIDKLRADESGFIQKLQKHQS